MGGRGTGPSDTQHSEQSITAADSNLISRDACTGNAAAIIPGASVRAGNLSKEAARSRGEGGRCVSLDGGSGDSLAPRSVAEYKTPNKIQLRGQQRRKAVIKNMGSVGG